MKRDKKSLSLHKETLRNLKVKTSLRGGQRAAGNDDGTTAFCFPSVNGDCHTDPSRCYCG